MISRVLFRRKYYMELEKSRKTSHNSMVCEPVAHICKPSYSGGRHQKDHGSKPAWANSSLRPCLTKKGWQSGSRCMPLVLQKKKKSPC
jgi:hypothetical protein